MSNSKDGEVILTKVFEAVFDHMRIIVQTAKINLPPYISFFVTPKVMDMMMGYIYDNIKYIPPEIKADIAIRVKKAMGVIDDEYVRSVIRRKPNLELASILESVGDLHFDGV